jgi:hypothetical protein
LEVEEIPGVKVLGILERPAGEANRRQRERTGGVRDCVRNRLRANGHCASQEAADEDCECAFVLQAPHCEKTSSM